MTKRTPRVALVVLAAASTGACTGGEAPPSNDSADRGGRAPSAATVPVVSARTGIEFCDAALARVDSFMTVVGRRAEPSASGAGSGGTAVVGIAGEMRGGMNGLTSSDYVGNQHHVFVQFATLIQFDADLNPIPYLAESWQIAEDGRSVSFRLRDDVFWHDGATTTAYDVAFTYERASDPATGFPNGAYWTHYEAVEVVDSFEVRFRMRPHAEPLDPWRSTAIMPAHLLSDVPAEELAEHPFGTLCPVGNGPFRFVEHRADDRWVFAANPAFPAALGGRPRVDRYVLRVIPDQNTLLAELLTGGIDVYVNASPDQAERIDASERSKLVHFPFRSYVFVGWNARTPGLDDARVRRAITMSTDREGMVRALLFGYGRVANASVPPSHWAYDPELEDAVPFDPEGARRLLADAGWIDRDGDGVRENENGVRLAFTIKASAGNEQRAQITEIMQAQLAAVGIQAQPRILEWTTLAGQITNPDSRDFDGFVLTWVSDFKIDDRGVFHSDSDAQPYGWAGTRSDTLDQLLERLPSIVNRDEAEPVWRAYQRALVAEQPYTFLFFQERLAGVSERLTSVHMDARGEWVGIRDWAVVPGARRGTMAGG